MLRYHPEYIQYGFSIDSEVICLWFTKNSVSTAELNLELKPQANDIQICPNLTYNAISHPINGI